MMAVQIYSCIRVVEDGEDRRGGKEEPMKHNDLLRLINEKHFMLEDISNLLVRTLYFCVGSDAVVNCNRPPFRSNPIICL